MSRAKVVIIEDEFFAAEHLRQLVKELDFEPTEVYHKGEDFLYNTDWNFDIAILDIFLSGEVTGLSIAEEAKKRNKSFVFITANKDSKTLREAALLGPSAYITKPFKENDVIAALEIVAFQLPKPLKIKTSKGTKVINPSDIAFIQSDGAYITIHTSKESYLQRKLLKEIIADLPDFFIRVHRSFLVNKHFIEDQTSKSVKVLNHIIPISRSHRTDLD